jgi:hypothetical protein
MVIPFMANKIISATPAYVSLLNRVRTAGPPVRFVSQADKDLIDKLLLERISLAGICRVCDVGQSWLQRYIKNKYADCPDDLNADLVLPVMDSYLSDRMDEEINRIQTQKKSQ